MNIIVVARMLIYLGFLILVPEMMAMGVEDGTDPLFEDPDFIDSSPGLGLLLLFTVIVVLILLGVGVVFGLVACGLAAGLMGPGDRALADISRRKSGEKRTQPPIVKSRHFVAWTA